MLATSSGGATSTYFYGNGADRLAALNGGVRTWYGTDNQGSVRQTLNDVAAVLSTQNYDPYGTPEGGTQPATFGYTGELQDAATSAVYLRARWYQPGTGTLLGVDPELDSTGQAYAYTGNNPLIGADPSGACYEVRGVVLGDWSSVGALGPCSVADSTAIHALNLPPTVLIPVTSAEAPLLNGYDQDAAESSARALISNASSCQMAGSAHGTYGISLRGLAITVGIGAQSGARGGAWGTAIAATVAIAAALITSVAIPATGSITQSPSLQPHNVYAADSNILFGRPANERYRTNVDNIRLMPPLIIAEVLGAPKVHTDANQRPRLAQGVAGEGVARIIPVGDPPMPAGWQAGLGEKFGVADAQLMQTAKLYHVKVLTDNKAMKDQVMDERHRKALWGDVQFEFPGWGITMP